MKNLSKIIFIILGIILCSCKKENQPLSLFSSAETLKDYEILDLDKYDILDLTNFYKEENYCVITHNKDSTMLTLLDLNTGKHLKGLKKGRGPNELTSLILMGIDNGIIYINDINFRRICAINIQECLNAGKIFYTTVETPRSFFKVDANSQYIVGLPYYVKEDDSVRLIAHNRLNKKSYYYNEYPKYLENLTPQLKFFSEVQTDIKFRKGFNDFVFFNRYGGLISIWKIENNKILLYKDLIFHLPKTHFRNFSLISDKDNKLGFRTVCTSKDYIFGSYEGRTQEESIKSNFGTENLFVFDWEGKPVKRYILPLTILVSYYDEEEDTIYGLNYDGETKVVKYKLGLKN